MAKLGIDCRQANWLLSRRRDASLTLRERMALGWHLRGCSDCRHVRDQLALIGLAARRIAD
jgi:hypothetical protein